MRAASRPRATTVLRVTCVVAIVFLAGSCTSSPGPDRGSIRPGVEMRAGSTEDRASEAEEQVEGVDERIEALEDARRTGTAGVVEPIRRAPAPGWAGEQIMNREGNDWEPSTAADPNAPYVFVLHNRYGGTPACRSRCPDPAMILHVSEDGGRTWRPESFICRCRGIGGQFDPLIEVAPATGDVLAAWMNGLHIVFARSSDHGATWSSPVRVMGAADWGDKPNMALSPDGQDVYILFNGPSDGDVWAASSHDGGATWAQVHVTRGSRYFYDYGGVVLPSERVVFAHASFAYRGPDAVGHMNVVVISSDDGGATWSRERVDRLRLGTPCTSKGCYGDFYDSGPAIAEDDDGDLVLVYNGARRPEAPQGVYARSSTDGGTTWGGRVRISTRGHDSAFPAAVGSGNNDVRVWYADRMRNRWNILFTTSSDLGATWTPPVRVSDAVSGTAYKDRRGFAEVYGDYGEIAITNTGDTFAVWGEGSSYAGPGGVWYNRQT